MVAFQAKSYTLNSSDFGKVLCFLFKIFSALWFFLLENRDSNCLSSKGCKDSYMLIFLNKLEQYMAHRMSQVNQCFPYLGMLQTSWGIYLPTANKFPSLGGLGLCISPVILTRVVIVMLALLPR